LKCITIGVTIELECKETHARLRNQSDQGLKDRFYRYDFLPVATHGHLPSEEYKILDVTEARPCHIASFATAHKLITWMSMWVGDPCYFGQDIYKCSVFGCRQHG
jgi:hypothetical protein